MVALAHDGTVNRSEPRDPDAAQLVSEQPKVARLLDDIVVSHRSLLGANLVGIYLHGSRATGDHGPHSDVDYLVVVERPLALAEKRQLLSALREPWPSDEVESRPRKDQSLPAAPQAQLSHR